MGLFSSKAKTETEVTPYDEAQLGDILRRLKTLGGTPQEFFPGQTYADMDPLQREALGMRESYARGLGGMVDPAMEAWQSTLTAPDVANNPYVQGMLEQQSNLLQRNFQESLPGIRAGMLGVNERLGGSGQGVAEGIAMRGMQDALARSAASTQLNAYGQGLAQQRFGLGAAPGMAQFGMMPANVLAGVGDIERSEAQRAIDEERARFEFGQEEPWRRLERQAALFNPLTLPYATQESTTKTSPSALQVGTQLAGAAVGLGGMFGGGGGGGGFAPMPTAAPSYPGMPQMYGMGSMTPMMGQYNPMQYPIY